MSVIELIKSWSDLKGSKNFAVEDAKDETSSDKEATSNSQPNNQNEILELLLLVRVATQETL